MSTEFQRIARRDKKAFLSDQCKELEENNRMGKTDISSRKLEISREHFIQRGTINDRKDMDLTEAEYIKKRCKNIQKSYTKNILMTQLTTTV